MTRLTYKLVIRDGTMCLRRSTAATFRSTRANQYYLATLPTTHKVTQ